MLDEVTVLIPRNEEDGNDVLQDTLDSLPKDKGVSVQVLPYKNGGLSSALNKGIQEAGTKYVFRLDAGNRLSGNCLDFLVSLAWNANVTYPSSILLSDFGVPEKSLAAPDFCQERLKRRNCVPVHSLIDRESLLEMGGYPDRPCLESWDLHLRLLSAGKKFKAVPEAYVYSYTTPTTIPSHVPREEAERIAKELGATAEEGKATFIYQASFPTTYYRCLLPAKYLPGVCYNIESFEVSLSEDDKISGFPMQEGALILQFPGDVIRAIYAAEMKEAGVPVLVEVDDNYTISTPHKHKGWVKKISDDRSTHSLEGHAKIVRIADGLIVTQQYLANQYKKFEIPTYICPNQVEPDDYPKLLKEPGPLKIGWFASYSHRGDAEKIERALEWASKQDDVEIWVMGLEPHWWKFRFKYIPWTNDLSTYHAMASMLDVGVAPVRDDPWSLCRSDLKALDYSVQGVAPVLSDNAPYSQWTHGDNCLKAKTPKEWLYTLKELVRDPSAVQDLARRANEYVLKERTIEGNCWRWQEALDDCSKRINSASTR